MVWYEIFNWFLVYVLYWWTCYQHNGYIEMYDSSSHEYVQGRIQNWCYWNGKKRAQFTGCDSELGGTLWLLQEGGCWSMLDRHSERYANGRTEIAGKWQYHIYYWGKNIFKWGRINQILGRLPTQTRYLHLQNIIKSNRNPWDRIPQRRPIHKQQPHKPILFLLHLLPSVFAFHGIHQSDVR